MKNFEVLRTDLAGRVGEERLVRAGREAAGEYDAERRRIWRRLGLALFGVYALGLPFAAFVVGVIQWPG